MTTVTVFGLGEAGKLYAVGLREAGATVRGYDPFVTVTDSSVDQVDTIVEAVDAADIVISLVGAGASSAVAESVIPHLGRATIFADFNTSSPAAKATLATMAAAHGNTFADVAVLAPVLRAGSKTPIMASGSGAAQLAELLRPLDVPIEAIGDKAGDAASRKLLRSIFMKGLAGVVLETVAAGEKAGNEEWIREQMAAEFGPRGLALLERLLSGSRAHAVRRTHEMEAALGYVTELGTPDWMTRGTVQWLSSLRQAAASTDPATENETRS